MRQDRRSEPRQSLNRNLSHAPSVTCSSVPLLKYAHRVLRVGPEGADGTSAGRCTESRGCLHTVVRHLAWVARFVH